MLLLFSGFIILSSRSCVPEQDTNRPARLKAAQDSTRMTIRKAFASEYLFENELMVYEEKAKQKLFDFADYLTLYADHQLDTAFKKQLKNMLFRLFYRTDAPLALSVIPSQPVRNTTLALLLESIDASPYTTIKFIATDTRTFVPMHRENADLYAGLLGTRITITATTENDTILLQDAMLSFRIVTKRTQKKFGAAPPQTVWQVFLDKTETGDTIAP
jgi:hypothetical protein